MENHQKHGQITLIFFHQWNGAHCSAYKTIFFFNKISRTIKAKTPTAPASVFFLLSAVFILAAALKMKVNE